MTNDIASENNKLQVILTGFDAFEASGFDKNTSGEAVKLIEGRKHAIEASCDIELTAEVIPVEYQYIDKCIPRLWEEVQSKFSPEGGERAAESPYGELLQPPMDTPTILSIHVGGSEAAGLVLECQAEKASYCIEDDQQQCPGAGENPCPGPDRLTTDLNVDEICSEFNQDLPEGWAAAQVSREAGKYLCEYIYYTSLALYDQNDMRKSSLFVHVPFKTEGEEIEEISQQLERLIKICVNHIRATQ